VVRQDDAVAPEPVVSPETVQRATADELGEALQTLPGEQREAILLCDLWGFRYDEIADIVDVRTGTVRSRIARGREAVMSRLASPDHGTPNGQSDRKGGAR
jgi:RNA polymerase sigma-70 factor (ECF subfamily)